MSSEFVIALVVLVAIAAHTDIPVQRVLVACRKSKVIHSDPQAQDGWRAT
jgi:hypothetical protein